MYPGSTTVLNVDFEDYVMYEPPSGIWVPEGKFTWTIHATATVDPDDDFNWTRTTQRAGLTAGPSMNHSWPSWVDISGNYNQIKWI